MKAIAQSKHRHLTERDLRDLSTAELIDLLRDDARELDTRLSKQGDQHDGLIAVYCCNRFLGRFMAAARVRCPRCGTWHSPGA